MATPCVNIVDYLFTGLGVSIDWTNDTLSFEFTGLNGGGEDWADALNYLFTGDGNVTDWCNGERTIVSFTGRYTVNPSQSVNYYAVVSPHHYKVVVTEPPKYTQP